MAKTRNLRTNDSDSYSVICESSLCGNGPCYRRFEWIISYWHDVFPFPDLVRIFAQWDIHARNSTKWNPHPDLKGYRFYTVAIHYWYSTIGLLLTTIKQFVNSKHLRIVWLPLLVVTILQTMLIIQSFIVVWCLAIIQVIAKFLAMFPRFMFLAHSGETPLMRSDYLQAQRHKDIYIVREYIIFALISKFDWLEKGISFMLYSPMKCQQIEPSFLNNQRYELYYFWVVFTVCRIGFTT